MGKKYRTWIHLWHDWDGNHCTVGKVVDGRRLEMAFRPGEASVRRLASIVAAHQHEGGRLDVSVVGVGWSWKKL